MVTEKKVRYDIHANYKMITFGKKEHSKKNYKQWNWKVAQSRVRIKPVEIQGFLHSLKKVIWHPWLLCFTTISRRKKFIVAWLRSLKRMMRNWLLKDSRQFQSKLNSSIDFKNLRERHWWHWLLQPVWSSQHENLKKKRSKGWKPLITPWR